MEIVLAIVGVLVLAAFAKWNEHRVDRSIRKRMDEVMGRNDPDYRG